MLAAINDEFTYSYQKNCPPLNDAELIGAENLSILANFT